MTTATEAQLPRWDLTTVFPAIDSAELAEEVAVLGREIDELGGLFDGQGVAADGGPVKAEVFEEVLARLNAVLERLRTVYAYTVAHVTADSRDEAAQARLSALRLQQVALAKLETRFVAWVGTADAEALVKESPAAAAHALMVRRARKAAQHLMSRPEEELAAELNPSGATAWGKLHRDVASQLTVELEVDGERRQLPMSEIRNLAHHADREVRRSAYEGELSCWEANAVPLAAAMNSIKGEVDTLARRRGWNSALEEALFANHIDRETLDAMMDAVRDAFPLLRRYFTAKARALGVPALAWYDLFAPLPQGKTNGGRTWDYDAARAFIAEQFGSYSDAMRAFAERAFRESWIDAEPRPGKTDGAFCLLVRADESRILCNYTRAYSGVSTLAHELGHGYHNVANAGQTPIQRRTPMTLAETASIFCETIVRDAALREASPAERLEILEGSLQSSTQTTVDVVGRFLFERNVFERRRERELSVSELCELMLSAQRETYGDGLDGALLHPYMWAVKPHYYSSYSFYNYPYTFGHLFGLGLYARYESNPDSFRAGYDELLASTGLDDAAALAARFDIDIRSPDFWRGSLRVIQADIARFEELVGA
jgi:pepF/M3 family oligoendopeptidase